MHGVTKAIRDFFSNRTRRFAFRASLLQATGFVVTVAVFTHLDSTVAHSKFGLRAYPMGYWIGLIGIGSATANYFIMTQATRWVYRITYPFFANVALSTLSLLNFSPPFPQVSMWGWFIAFALVGLVASWVRFFRLPPAKRLTNTSVPLRCRVEWIKESSSYGGRYLYL